MASVSVLKGNHFLLCINRSVSHTMEMNYFLRILAMLEAQKWPLFYISFKKLVFRILIDCILRDLASSIASILNIETSAIFSNKNPHLRFVDVFLELKSCKGLKVAFHYHDVLHDNLVWVTIKWACIKTNREKKKSHHQIITGNKTKMTELIMQELFI